MLGGRGALAAQAKPQRPQYLRRSEAWQIFIERERKRRVPGGDKWSNSGGIKGSTENWFDSQRGVRKRYGKVVLNDGGPPVKFSEYTLISNQADPVENKKTVAFVTTGRRPGQTGLRSANNVVSGSPDTPLSTVLRVAAALNQSRFISFAATSSSGQGGKADIELGAIVQAGNGVKLESAQGDFAEWHRRQDGEPAFAEGDVIGFGADGTLSRRTTAAGCRMFGVVSRKAVVEGSAPPQAERGDYDTIAYTGVVPVKVLRPIGGSSDSTGVLMAGPAGGDILVPSGRDDGTAVVVSGRSRQGLARRPQLVGMVLAATEWTVLPGEVQLVSAVAVSPGESGALGGAFRVSVRWQWVAGLFLLLLLWVLAIAQLFERSAGGGGGGQAGPLLVPLVPAPVETPAVSDCKTVVRAACAGKAGERGLVASTNRWLAGNPASCTQPERCRYSVPPDEPNSRGQPCGQCRGDHVEAGAVGPSDPYCDALFSNPIDSGFGNNPHGPFGELVYTRCPNVQVVLNADGNYSRAEFADGSPQNFHKKFSHECVAGRVVAEYQTDGRGHLVGPQPAPRGVLAAGLSLSLTGVRQRSSLLKAVITAFPCVSLPFLAVPLLSQPTVALSTCGPAWTTATRGPSPPRAAACLQPAWCSPR